MLVVELFQIHCKPFSLCTVTQKFILGVYIYDDCKRVVVGLLAIAVVICMKQFVKVNSDIITFLGLNVRRGDTES